MSKTLVHATMSNKAKSIQKKGFKVTPRTKKSTAFCKRNEYDCQRAEAYQCSEDILERARKKIAPHLPSRKNAMFFQDGDESAWLSEGDAFKTGEEDEWGRPIYDFGFGKDVLFTVNYDKIPCGCGVGDNGESDEVFRGCLNGEAKEELEKKAEKFWKKAEKYDETYDPFKMDNDDRTHEMPEIWCPCPIPKDVIIDKYDKKNPPPS